MRISRIFNILGLLQMFLAFAMLLPIPFALFYKEEFFSFVWSAAITFVAGLAAFLITRAFGFRKELRTKEGFAIVTLGWLCFSVFGALPYVLSGAIPAVADAFFETMSGFTTTGASILEDIEALPKAVLFWRSLTQWIGGMGIVVLSIAILPFLGVGGMQLFKAEVPGPTADKLTPRIAETAKILWGVYLLITVAQTVLLMLGRMSFFDAICHAFCTVSSGGYSTRAASVGAFGSAYIDIVIIFFMLLAGINFSLHYRALKGNLRAYRDNRELRFFLVILGLAVLVIGADVLFSQYEGNVARTLQFTAFQAASIMTTTGFGTADYEHWAFSSQFTLFVLMLIGGSAGSTAGGMKVIRIYVLIKFVLSEIVRLLHPHAVVPVRIGGKAVPRDVVLNVLGFFVLFMLVFVVSVFFMSSLGLDIKTSFGAVAASLANIGPGLGDVGPTDNYGGMPLAAKWFLSALMLMGRLELFTVIILLSPRYWRR